MLALLIAACSALADPPIVTRAEFDRVHARLLPGTTAPWERVPWSIDLLGAARRSAREGKPLFIWAMNGHPLGCV